MISTSKKRMAIAAALLIFVALSIAQFQSKPRNSRQLQQKDPPQKEVVVVEEVPPKVKESVEEVPPKVKESMDPKLIDFVVAGFAKCGTTFLQRAVLNKTHGLFFPREEIHALNKDKFKKFKKVFADVPQLQQKSSKPLVVGYKAPDQLISTRALRSLTTLFPDMKMIVNVRHPILQFQSFYNFRLRHRDMMPVEKYVGLCKDECELFHSSAQTAVDQKSSNKCIEPHAILCSGLSNFHRYLSRLGLTPMNTLEELDLLDHHPLSIHPFTGKLFLIELGQMDYVKNINMTNDLFTDLEDFLGLDYGDIPRPKPKPRRPHKEIPGKEKLNICLERYKPLREELLEYSRKTSRWILEYLLHPSNRDVVRVSNMDAFKKMVEGWKVDPCLNEDDASE